MKLKLQHGVWMVYRDGYGVAIKWSRGLTEKQAYALHLDQILDLDERLTEAKVRSTIPEHTMKRFGTGLE